MVYRHDTYWGAPRMGFCYDLPRMDFGPRPIHHGNPFAAFMGGVFGGLMASSVCGWSNSYVGYPGASVSIFPRSYSPSQSYNSFGYASFGYDYSALALNDAYARFVDSFSMPRYATAPTQMTTSNWTMLSSGWTMPTQESNYWSTPAPAQTWSQPFSSLTQSARSGQTYSVIPPRPKTQTSAQTSAQVGNSQPQSSGAMANNTYTLIPVKNAATANQNSQTVVPNLGTQSNNASTVETPPSVQAVDTGSANITEVKDGDSLSIIGDASKSGVKPSVVENSTQLKVQALVPFKQNYNVIMNKLEQTSKPGLADVDPELHNGVTQASQMTLAPMDEIEARGTEPNSGEKELINDKLKDLDHYVTKYQDRYKIDNTPPKTQEQLKAEEDAFNASCKGGDCGDYSDRWHYNLGKGEWEKSTKLGYPKQPLAPASTLVEVPMEYTIDKSGTKYYANPEALEHFIEMSKVSFSQRGIQLAVKSSYRDYKGQENEFEADKERLRKANEAWDNLTPEKQKKVHKPLPKAAPPGYSEHHTGYPFDIGDDSPIDSRNDGDFLTDKNGEFVIDKKTGKPIPIAARVKWLEKNAKFFGFEMSYPPDNKMDVLQEGWHWRFNPELCEKYKNEREALLEKYKQGDTEATATSEPEDILEQAKSAGMGAVGQRYNEIMEGIDQSKDADVSDRYIAGRIGDVQEKLMDALKDKDNDSCDKYLKSLAKLASEYKKISARNQELSLPDQSLDKVNTPSEAVERAKTILSSPLPKNKKELSDQIYELNALYPKLSEAFSTGAINAEFSIKVDARILKMHRILNPKINK